MAELNSEYKGFGGGTLILYGDYVYLKWAFLKEYCHLKDITDITFRRPIGVSFGELHISTIKNSQAPYALFFTKKHEDEFTELYEYLLENTSATPYDPVAAAAAAAGIAVASNVPTCPKCGSTSISANKKGFGVGKAVVGTAVAGPIGLVAGNIGASKVRITCLNCGHTWTAGKA